MTLATIRGDGYPQATTVSFARDGLTLYFGCAGASQKARNLARHDKIPLTINLPYANWGEIRGASMGGRATLVRDPRAAEQAGRHLLRSFRRASPSMRPTAWRAWRCFGSCRR